MKYYIKASRDNESYINKVICEGYNIFIPTYTKKEAFTFNLKSARLNILKMTHFYDGYSYKIIPTEN